MEEKNKILMKRETSFKKSDKEKGRKSSESLNTTRTLSDGVFHFLARKKWEYWRSKQGYRVNTPGECRSGGFCKDEGCGWGDDLDSGPRVTDVGG